jgi:uncharacterized membrane protein
LTGRGGSVAGLALSALLGLSLGQPPPAAGDPDGAVRAVLFASPTCPHCRTVIEEVLPPLLERFGGRLEVGVLSTATPVGRDLYWAAHRRFGIRQRGVPLLVVGDFALVGSDEIPRRLPGLVAGYLAEGGVGWPDIPGLAELLAPSAPPPGPSPAVAAPGAPRPAPPPAPLATPPVPQEPAPVPVAPSAPPPTGAPLATPEPSPPLAAPSTPMPPTPAPGLAPAATSRSRPAPRRAAPLPRPTAKASTVTVPAPPAEPAGGTEVSGPRPPTPSAATPPSLISLEAGADPGLVDHLRADPYGNGLALLVLLGMAAAILRSAAVLRRGVAPARRSRLDALNPLLALAGLGVAAYLAHVEVQEIEAVCGPVGDCNTVQQSEYARLFGVLPIGVLGVAGFAAILVGWGVRRFGSGRATAWASVALLALTGFGTLFSIYLTFLEPFVIGASCLWCLSSAVIMTALYGLAVVPARAAAVGVRRRPAPGFSRHIT